MLPIEIFIITSQQQKNRERFNNLLMKTFDCNFGFSNRARIQTVLLLTRAAGVDEKERSGPYLFYQSIMVAAQPFSIDVDEYVLAKQKGKTVQSFLQGAPVTYGL